MSRMYFDPRMKDPVKRMAPATRWMWHALITHRFSQSVPGLLAMSEAMFASEQYVSFPEMHELLTPLFNASLLRYDDDAELFCIPSAPLYFPKPGPNQIMGWYRHWATIPESPLKYGHVAALEHLVAGVGSKSPIAEAWARTFGCHVPLRIGDGSLMIGDGPKQLEMPYPNKINTKGGVTEGTETDPDPLPDQDPDLDPDTDQSPPTGKILTLPSVAARPERFWERQEQLRAEVFGTAPGKPTSANLARVAACLEATGASDDQVEAVLGEFKREAIEKGTSVWFDGWKNWSVESFKIALVKAQKQPRKSNGLGHFKATADVQYPDGLVDLNLVR